MHQHKGFLRTRMQISVTEANCVSSALISSMCNRNRTKETNWWWQGLFFPAISLVLCFLNCSLFFFENFILYIYIYNFTSVIWKRSTNRKIVSKWVNSWMVGFSLFLMRCFSVGFNGRREKFIIVFHSANTFCCWLKIIGKGVVKSVQLFHLTFL